MPLFKILCGSMQQSVIDKLEAMQKRHREIGELLAQADVIGNQNRFRELAKEYSTLDDIVHSFDKYNLSLKKMAEVENILQSEQDRELAELAREELNYLREEVEKLSNEIGILLLPRDANDGRNVFLEIRAGAGGNEAAIFAGDLFRMYVRYADLSGWQVEIVNSQEGEHGGYREIIARLAGKGAYSKMKFESGVHRVQRVPATESQGRVHTSTCTVAVIAEADEVDEIEVNPADLKIDTYRSSGAGGQHVNVTDSAIRITHLPTGVVVECQDERSQHKNRARAMALLKARLLAAEQEKQKKEEAATRKSMVGTGDRSERIRTYNFPQGRLTDHRINLTLYQLDRILGGNLDLLIIPLTQEYHAAQMAHCAGSG